MAEPAPGTEPGEASGGTDEQVPTDDYAPDLTAILYKGRRPLRLSRSEWFQLAPALALAYLVLRVGSIARGDPVTSLAIVRVASLVNLVAGNLVQNLGALVLVGYLLAFALVLTDWSREAMDKIRRASVSASTNIAVESKWLHLAVIAAVGAIMFTPAWLLVIGILVSTLWVWERNRADSALDDRLEKERPNALSLVDVEGSLSVLRDYAAGHVRMTRRFFFRYLPAVALLLMWVVLLRTSPWLPAERISRFQGLPITGYVLDTSDGWVTILNDSNRLVQRVPIDTVKQRTVCSTSNLPRGFQALLDRSLPQVAIALVDGKNLPPSC